jgi:hypothetical protein
MLEKKRRQNSLLELFFFWGGMSQWPPDSAPLKFSGMDAGFIILKIFLYSDGTTLTFNNKSNHGDHVYQVLWSWSLWFGLYPAYKVFLLSDAKTLTLDKQKYSSLIMVIKCTKLCDPEAYNLVFILLTKFYYQVTIQPGYLHLWPWKTKGFFLLSWWFKCTSMILKLTDGQSYTTPSPV